MTRKKNQEDHLEDSKHPETPENKGGGDGDENEGGDENAGEREIRNLITYFHKQEMPRESKGM